MKTFIAIVTAIALALSTSAPAFAHSGGTNKYGCHAGSKPYHCHNSKNESSFESKDDSSAIGVILGVVGVILGVTIVFALIGGDEIDTGPVTFDADGNPITQEGNVSATIKW